MISEAQIRYILSVHRESNFKRAAEASFVTQPTLSMQIKKAEDTLGYSIFNRDTYPVKLSTFGEEILPYLLEVENTFDALSQFISKKEGKFKEEIVLGIIPTISAYLVPKLYSFWEVILPNIKLKVKELNSEHLLEAVSAKRIDAGIMAGPLLESNLITLPLFNEKIEVYAPTINSKKVDKESLSLHQPWLLSKGNCLRTQMINFCEIKKNLAQDWDYEGGNMQILIDMAKAKGGYTLLPEYFAKQYPSLLPSIKTLKGKQPARSIVGFHLPRNSKAQSLGLLFKKIKQSYPQEKQEEIEILQWK